MNIKEITDWLLAGDVSVQYQAYRDLLGEDRKDLQQRISNEGWGQRFLLNRKENGHWGMRFYQPKWTSTHYTLLGLRNLNLPPENQEVKATIKSVLNESKASDGGIQLGPSTAMHSDVCVNGMFLNYASYFNTPEQELKSIVDSLLNEIMPDGGFNCITQLNGSKHSSLHTTLSVIEGMVEFLKTGYSYRKNELEQAIASAEEFILKHQLFLSDNTGKIINREFLKLTFPCRWRYDILRALDYFRYSQRSWDKRMEPTIQVLHKKRRKDGRWNMQAHHHGKVHFEMEKAGMPSRWNTLRALRVFKHIT